MRNRCLPLLLLLTATTWFGCGPKDSESADTAALKAPIDNNSPQAKSAVAAPGPGRDVPRPGGGKVK